MADLKPVSWVPPSLVRTLLTKGKDIVRVTAIILEGLIPSEILVDLHQYRWLVSAFPVLIQVRQILNPIFTVGILHELSSPRKSVNVIVTFLRRKADSFETLWDSVKFEVSCWKDARIRHRCCNLLYLSRLRRFHQSFQALLQGDHHFQNVMINTTVSTSPSQLDSALTTEEPTPWIQKSYNQFCPNLPPAWRTVKITSTVGLPMVCIPVGIPRPESETETNHPI